jgi:hypothetical protein
MAEESVPNDDETAAIRVIVTIQQPDVPASPENSSLAGRLGKFFSSNVGAAILTLIFTSVIGGLIANHFTEQQREAADYSQRVTSTETNRRALIDSFSKTFAGRRAAVGLVKSIILTGGSSKELDDRWAAYQQAYLAYALNDFTFKSDVIEYLGAATGGSFIATVDRSLTSSLARIDTCITNAYRLNAAGRTSAAQAALSNCHVDKPRSRIWAVADEADRLQGCFATFETELMYSIYLENRFDRMSVRQRESDRIRLLPRAGGKALSVDIEAVSRQPIGKYKCESPTDWACQRVLARSAVKAELAQPTCKKLSESYYETSAASTSIALSHSKSSAAQ